MTDQEKYEKLNEYLKGVLKTAKKLGLRVEPNGGYSMGYSINNLPPYPVGLMGALSIIEGEGARCKLGLTFDETMSLEYGFNTRVPDKKERRKRKFYPELWKIGADLGATLIKKRPGLWEEDEGPQYWKVSASKSKKVFETTGWDSSNGWSGTTTSTGTFGTFTISGAPTANGGAWATIPADNGFVATAPAQPVAINDDFELLPAEEDIDVIMQEAVANPTEVAPPSFDEEE